MPIVLIVSHWVIRCFGGGAGRMWFVLAGLGPSGGMHIGRHEADEARRVVGVAAGVT